MQRRVATVYFVFFVVMAASAYAVIAVAEQPAVDIQGETYAANESLTIDGTTYTVSKATLESSSGGGGHGGGGGGGSYSGTIKWTNSSFRYTATLANNSTVSYRDGTYRVLIPNKSDPSSFTLRQEFNVSQRLRNDSAVENQTYTAEDGSKFVRYKNGSTQPLKEYLPAPNSRQVSEGDTLDYQGNTTTVATVTAEEATLAWTSEKQQSVTFGEGENISLSGTQYLAHFEGHGDNVRVILARTSQAYDAYSADLARRDYFQERMSGLWGVVLLSSLVAILIASLAFLPKKG